MSYVIDTDILIYYLKDNPKVVERFVNEEINQLSTTIINYTELLFGAHKSAKSAENLVNIKRFLNSLKIVDFDKNAAEIFAQLKARLQTEGNVIADMDLLIASICMANDLILVSNNVRHFGRIEGLMLENWSL